MHDGWRVRSDERGRDRDGTAALRGGLSNDEIGARLFVSSKTVDHHISAILAKLGVASRGAAVAQAHRSGLLPPLGSS